MAGYRSFLFPGSTVEADFLILDGRESHHLVRVLRAQIGASIEVLDGQGASYRGTIKVADPKAVQITVENKVMNERSGPRVRLVQALSKGKAMDLILRMATEIGASEVQPVFTDQGEVQMSGDRLSSKVDKWRLTTIESCKQCGLPFLPKLRDPLSLKDWVTRENLETKTLRLVASLEEGSRSLLEVLQVKASVVDWVEVAIGPEGDFSTREYALLNEAGFVPVRLGANVLRAETAAAYILSVVDQVTSVQNRGS